MNSEHENGNVNGNETRMEQALRASELSYRRLFEAAQDGILILDMDTGRITDANPYLFNLLGYSHGEMVGKTVGELSPFKDIESNQVMLERLQENGYVRYHDLPLETRNGRKIAVEFVSNVYQAGDKKVIQCNIRDITQRKSDDGRMRHLSQAVEQSPVSVVITDTQGTIEYVNRKFTEVTGYSLAEVVGKNSRILKSGECPPATYQEMWTRITSGETWSGEFHNRKKNGELFWEWAVISPVLDASGKTTHFLAIKEDITDRRRAEKTANLLAAIVESSDDAIIGKDLDGTIQSWNTGAEKLFGYTTGEMTGGSIMRLIPADRQVEEKQVLEKIRHGESMRNLETVWRAKDGRRIDLSVTVSPIKDTTGRLVGASKVARDITERKQAEAQLRLFRTLVGQSNDSIMVVDPETGRFLVVNEQGCLSRGYSREEFLALHVFDIDATVGLAEFKKVVEELREKGVLTWQGLHRQKDGSTFPVEVNLKYVRLDRDYIVAAVRDTTERRKLEAQFIEAQKMEVVGQLAGGVAHDFNNILSIIMGYNNLIEADLEPDSPLRKYTEQVQHSADRATGLTQQLLIFSRKQKVQPVVLDINDAVKDLEKMLRRLVDEHVEMEFFPGKQTGRIKADPGYLWQVLMNLVVNARDAMPNGGKLTIATKNVMLDGNYARTHTGVIPGNYVMMSVGDKGTGMTDEVKARMFEAFFTTKPEGKGTGLGLATCQTIVQQSGGHIDVDSRAGRGTTFKIYFPQVDEPLDTDANFIKAGPLPRGTETLLLVEDEPGLRHLAQRVLEAQGYTVLLAANGQDALHVALVHKGPPIHLVLTDVIMPQMGGKVMAEWLKTTYPDLKILFTSGYTDEAMAQHGVFKAGIDFLAKPFTPAALARKVRELLDQSNVPTANPAR